MQNKKKNSKHILAKALVIGLSFIVLFNGLGLIIAGKRVGKKKWIGFGIAYIVSEIILGATTVGVPIATALYFISIIHTTLICPEYGRLLNGAEANQFIVSKEEIIEKTKQVEVTPQANVTISNGGSEETQRIPLSVGSANVTINSVDQLNIVINCENGRTYEFRTEGNEVTAYGVNGKMHNYGG